MISSSRFIFAAGGKAATSPLLEEERLPLHIYKEKMKIKSTASVSAGDYVLQVDCR